MGGIVATVRHGRPASLQVAGMLYSKAWPATSAPAIMTTEYSIMIASKAAHYDNFVPTSPQASPYPAIVFRFELETGLTTILTSNSLSITYPQVSADGRFVAFEDSTQVYVYDAMLHTNILVSAALE